ncbi:MAG: hypothetical protein GXY43_04910 [Clostridiaceae bacterium]|nr:hypothetical protein [Clostridiaceae bacterium]
MISRKQAFIFFLGALLTVVGLCVLIMGEVNNLYLRLSGGDESQFLTYALFYVPVLGFGGLFLGWGRRVFFERKAIFARHRRKIIVSLISAVLMIIFSFYLVYSNNHDYGGFMGGATEFFTALLTWCLIPLINIIMWLIVLIKSWITDGFSRKPESRAE